MRKNILVGGVVLAAGVYVAQKYLSAAFEPASEKDVHQEDVHTDFSGLDAHPDINEFLQTRQNHDRELDQAHLVATFSPK